MKTRKKKPIGLTKAEALRRVRDLNKRVIDPELAKATKELAKATKILADGGSFEQGQRAAIKARRAAIKAINILRQIPPPRFQSRGPPRATAIRAKRCGTKHY